MTQKIIRNYLEIKSYEDFKKVEKPSENYSVEIVEPEDFLLNKFVFCERKLRDKIQYHSIF